MEGASAQHIVGLALAVLAGSLMAVQSLMNGSLAGAFGAALPAAAWSLGSGLVLSSLIVFGTAGGRKAAHALRRNVAQRRIPLWECLGGLGGGLLIGTQAWSVPLIGVALFTLSVIAGQTVCSIVLDAIGFSPGAARPITIRRLLAAALSIAGVALFSAARGLGPVEVAAAVSVGVGAGTAVQSAVNARLRAATSSVPVTTWMNFVVAFGALGLILVATGGFEASKVGAGVAQTEGWMWAGGVCGVIFVSTAAWAIAHIGVLTYMVTVTTSHIAVAGVLDVAAGAGSPTAFEIGGMLVTLMGALIMGSERTGRSRPRRGVA